MSKGKSILTMAFLLSLAAGAAVGVVGARAVPHNERRSWLSDELNLSPDQQRQMKEIWSGIARGGGRDHMDRVRALQKERDEAIVSMLTAQQMARYEEVSRAYSQKMEAMSQERERAFQQAVEQTKKILSPEQRTKYEELMKRKRGEHAERGEMPGGMGPSRGGRRDRSTSPAQ